MANVCVLVLQSNFSLPPELRDGNSPTVINSPAVYNVPAKAGDCVIFKSAHCRPFAPKVSVVC